MMKKHYLIINLFLSSIISFAQQNPFYVGHSLVNQDMPAMTQALAVNASKTSSFGYQIINGSSLQYNYNNAAGAQGTSFFNAFPAGNFNKLIVTEAVPLQNHLTWSASYQYANNFYTYAKNNNSGKPLKFYIYETWHCINSGILGTNGTTYGCAYDDSQNSTLLWYPRLKADFPLWTGIVNSVRSQNNTDTQIWMVPAGQAMYNLATLINAGSVPGISSIRELFKDDIHLTNKGNYFIACVMFSCIYEQSPQGLTNSLNTIYGTAYDDMPTTAQATIMQRIAWDTVTSLSSWTGIQSLDVVEFNKDKKAIVYYIKNHLLTLDFKAFDPKNINIFNALGQKVLSAVTNETHVVIDVSGLATGVYYMKNNQTNVGKFSR
ncbi:T9SS type A sorting domain-containing protein [Flavobacterium muglaense]|uniref:T9SS type A sorting domain-containing protein n=1 Tax=Flavobacterium muglaense TaxID=2764716 RepID=A0A923MZF3_9FLAO|nr:T9SS type A sorting domain-containing protein [Flavobacterium muglaense]MBC5837721.1 T9SS type A sorting domain-containing protein [Flavobacterium muglaense]MBC5844247.1 T9SS type A sorting domain-containing protein [Flavobacterium muglaense]